MTYNAFATPLSIILLALCAVAGHAAAASSAAGDHRVADRLSFTAIEAGCFDMGSDQVFKAATGLIPPGPRADETPRHEVCVDAFEMGTVEVTRSQWAQVMDSPPPPPEQSQWPQTRVTWEAAQQFLSQLNRQAEQYRYRLPTEAEWEYACLAGASERGIAYNTQQQVTKQLRHAWFNEPVRTEATARPVGELQPNAWGLHDMLGNVWEWVSDSYRADAYQQHPKHNPHVLDIDSEAHVIRGGSYNSHSYLVRCGTRSYGLNQDPQRTQGLRIAREKRLSPSRSTAVDGRQHGSM